MVGKDTAVYGSEEMTDTKPLFTRPLFTTRLESNMTFDKVEKICSIAAIAIGVLGIVAQLVGWRAPGLVAFVISISFIVASIFVGYGAEDD
jgi:Na+(H+)/acetate symporter ActP